MTKDKKIFYDSVQSQQDEFNDQILKNAGKETIGHLIKDAVGSANKKKAPRLAFTENPHNNANYAGIFKIKTDLLPDNVIKKIRSSNLLVATILRARANTLSMFGNSRKDRFDIGVEIDIRREFKDHIDPEDQIKITRRISRFEKILLSCGHVDGLKQTEKTTFADFLYVQTQNGLSFGRFATEVINDENGNFHRFRVSDAGTIYRALTRADGTAKGIRESSIRLLESLTDVKIDKAVLQEDGYDWIQVINGAPKQAFTSDEMLVYNMFPTSDIEFNGYPLTPLDTAINAVTTYMGVETYNKLYFQNGRAAKGMLVIQSDEIDENTIQDIKQQYNASVNNVNNSFRTPIFGVSKEDTVNWIQTTPNKKDGEFEFLYDQVCRNILSAFNISPDELPGFGHLSKGSNQMTLSECLHLDSKIYVPEGYKSISAILKEAEVVHSKIWTGKDWVDGKIFKTGEKQLVETVVNNGVSLKTSPDHYFRVVNDFGELDWKKQSDLRISDCVLLNKKDVETNNVPKYKGKELTPEMLEVLGWLTGDGTIVANRKRAGATFHFFYNSEKEQQIQKRHLKIMSDFGLNPLEKNKEISPEEQEKIKKRYGFKTVAKSRIKTMLYDTEFYSFLSSLGFRSSKESKTIPDFIYTMSLQHRAAFLRGLFSADGHKDYNNQVFLTISNKENRQKVIELLLSLGIRCSQYEGKTKVMFVNGCERQTIEGGNKISVCDKSLFFEKIGFLQDHKQPLNLNKDIVRIPQSLQYKFSQDLIDMRNRGVSIDKDDIYVLRCENRGVTLDRAKNIFKKYNQDLPSWTEEYNFSYVTDLIDHNEIVQMADITLNDKEHAFVANGFVVHNSNNEFKLTAARDTGIRPLILKMQDFVNRFLFPIIDPELSQLCTVSLSGFDAKTRDQEAQLLTSEMPIHYSYDEVMQEVEKEPVGPSMCGGFAFNERYMQIAEQYKTVGEMMGFFADSPSAVVDPMLKYTKDPFFFQNLQVMAEFNPEAVRAWFATRSDAMEVLKVYVQDYHDQADIDDNKEDKE